MPARDADLIDFATGDALLDWPGVCTALRDGHQYPRGAIADQVLARGPDRLLTRMAWIDGLGCAVKTACIFPGNTAVGRPSVNGALALFSDATGELEALVDFHLVTKWKTAADSLLAARLLARPDANHILILGAGAVATSMVDAYASAFPNARFRLWNRNTERAERLARQLSSRHIIAVAEHLDDAIPSADIICAATMSSQPLIHGKSLAPGTHLDLIGAFTADMREADDDALRRARIFVDSRDTTLDHIGELRDPIMRGVISPSAVIADFYDIEAGRFARNSTNDITLFKNGGGAHLDLMTARHVLARLHDG